MKKTREQLVFELEQKQKQFYKDMMKKLWFQFQRQFDHWFQHTHSDYLELFILYPSDNCDQTHCEGWKYYYKEGILVEEFLEEIEEYLLDYYDENENKVETRMAKMTDKKAIRLMGKDYFEETFPICPHKLYCDYN